MGALEGTQRMSLAEYRALVAKGAVAKVKRAILKKTCIGPASTWCECYHYAILSCAGWSITLQAGNVQRAKPGN